LFGRLAFRVGLLVDADGGGDGMLRGVEILVESVLGAVEGVDGVVVVAIVVVVIVVVAFVVDDNVAVAVVVDVVIVVVVVGVDGIVVPRLLTLLLLAPLGECWVPL
jgi:hypothetical protein